MAGRVELVAEPLRTANVHAFSDAELISTFIYSDLGMTVLEQLPSLKLIATRSTGCDHIDTAYCAARGIAVSNVPIYGENTVAEQSRLKRQPPTNADAGSLGWTLILAL